MKIRQLEYVHYIVHYKTMREAARNLFVTEPTISQQVKELEKHLGFTIFEKDGRRIKLTAEGEKIYPDILNIIESMESLKHNVASIRNPDSGVITLGLGPVASKNLIQTLLNKFKEKYPNVTVNIIDSGSMDLVDSLESSKVDIALINTSSATRLYMETKNIKCKSLFNSNFVLMVPDNHRLSKEELVSYKEISNEPIMLYRDGVVQRSIIQLLGPKYEKNIIYSFVDYISIINLVRDGVGISIVPKSHAESWSKEQIKGISFLEFHDFGKTMNVSCVYKKMRYYPKYLQDFIKLISLTVKK